MSIELNFYVKQENGTVPLQVKEPSIIISQLLKSDIAEFNSVNYLYQDLRIQKKTVSIFISPIQD